MQKSDFLTSLLEPVRAKIIRLLVLNDTVLFTLAEIAQRCGIPAKVAQKELLFLLSINVARMYEGDGKNAGERKANTRYSFNNRSRYANALSAFVHEVSPERFNDVERVLRATGKLNVILLSGVFLGDVRRPSDLLLVGEDVSEKRLEKALKSFEPKYGEIRYTVFSTPEFRYRMTINDKLVRDTLDYPHRLLLNKKNLI